MPGALTAAIVAGGRGRRLGGRDKPGLVVDGTRLLDRQLSVLGHVAEHILIVSNDLHRFRASGLRVCADLIPDAGPLSGLYTALVRAPTDRTLVVACDLPFLHASFLRHLAARVGDCDAAVPRTADGPQPLCAVYAARCAAPVHEALARGERRVETVVRALRVAELGPDELKRFDPDDAMMCNLNTPDDHRRAERLAAARRTLAGARPPVHDRRP